MAIFVKGQRTRRFCFVMDIERRERKVEGDTVGVL